MKAGTVYCVDCKTWHVVDRHITEKFYQDLASVQDSWRVRAWMKFWNCIKLIIGPKLHSKLVAFLMRRMGWTK